MGKECVNIIFSVHEGTNLSWNEFVNNVLSNVEDEHYGAYTYQLEEPMTIVQIGVMVEELCGKLQNVIPCRAKGSLTDVCTCADSSLINYAKFVIGLDVDDTFMLYNSICD